MNKYQTKIIISGIVAVLASTFVIQVISFVRAFAFPLIMNPNEYAEWVLVLVVVGYGAHFHLGIIYNFGKEYPKLLQKKMYDEANYLRDSTVSHNVLFAVIGSIIFATVNYRLNAVPILSVVVTSFVVILQSYYIFILCLFRSEGKFHRYSLTTLVYGLLLTIATLGAAHLWKEGGLEAINGALLGLLLAHTLICIYLHTSYNTEYSFRIKFDVSSLRRSIYLGFPQLIIGFLDVIIMTQDRWLFALFFDKHKLGVYSFGILFAIIVMALPLAVSQVLYTSFLRLNAGDSKANASEFYFVMFQPVVSYVSAFIVIALHFALPHVIPAFFPEYSSSILISTYLLYGAYHLALSQISGMYLIATDKHVAMVIVQVLSIAIGFAVSLFGIVSGYGDISIVAGTVFMFMLYGIGYTYLVVLNCTSSHLRSMGFCIKLLIPMYLISFYFFAMQKLTGNQSQITALEVFQQMVIPLSIMTIAYWIVFDQQRLQICGYLRNRLSRI